MRFPIYLICTALVIAIRADDNTAEYYGPFVEPIGLASQQEPLNPYFLPKFAAKYKEEFAPLIDPSLYMGIDEMNSNSDRLINRSPEPRIKRAEYLRQRGSLSIVNSLDALRNKLVMEITRKKTQQNAERNRQFLQSFGKRSYLPHRSMEKFNNL